MSEHIIDKTEARPFPATAVGTRAIALCVGCPMANLCQKKIITPCESPIEQHVVVDRGGAVEAVYEQPKSYRKELMDDSIETVIAQVQPAPPVPMKRSGQAKPVPQSKIPTKQLPVSAPRMKKPTPRRIPGETIGDAIADFFALALGREAVGAVSKKR